MTIEFKQATDEISAVLNKFDALGFEFQPREGIIVVFFWAADDRLHTLGAIIEGNETTPHGWHYVPKSEVPDLN